MSIGCQNTDDQLLPVTFVASFFPYKIKANKYHITVSRIYLCLCQNSSKSAEQLRQESVTNKPKSINFQIHLQHQSQLLNKSQRMTCMYALKTSASLVQSSDTQQHDRTITTSPKQLHGTTHLFTDRATSPSKIVRNNQRPVQQ